MPAYPPDWGTVVRDLQRGVRTAYTAAQTRVRYAAIRAASIIIGDQAAARWIGLDPGAEDRPARIRLATPAGHGELAVRADAAGTTWTALAATAASGRTALELLPTRGGIWATPAEGEQTTIQITSEGGVYAGPMDDRAGATLALGETTAYVTGPRGQQHGRLAVQSGGAFIAAYSPGGSSVAAAIGVTAAGQITWTGSWSPPPSTMSARTVAATSPDPGPDAPLDAQVAWLRQVVEAQAAQLAQLRAVIDDLPPFVRADPDGGGER